jgi:spermidine synthase
MKKNQIIFYFSIAFLLSGICMMYQLTFMTIIVYIMESTVMVFSILSGIFLIGLGVGAFLADAYKINFLNSQLLLLISAPILILCPLVGIYCPDNFLVLELTGNLISGAFCVLIQFFIGTIAGCILPGIRILVDERCPANSNINKIMGFDYLGSFTGAAIFPILLLPFFGVFKGTALIALCHAVVLLFLFWAKGEKAAWRKIIIVLLILAWTCLFKYSNVFEQAITEKLTNDF